MKRNAFLGILAFLGVAVGLSFGATPALAHNTFQSSAPADNEVLQSPPTTWTVRFAKSVPLESASGSVVNGDGTRTALGSPRHGDNDTTIVFDLPTTLTGTVTARWRLVSVDGHVISGRVTFTVNSFAGTTTIPNGVVGTTTVPNKASDGTVAEPQDVGESSGISEPIRVSLRMINYLALVLLGGILFAELDIASGAIATLRGRQFARWGSLGITIIPILQFLTFVGDIRRVGQPLGSALSDAFSLTPGAMMILRATIGMLIIVLMAAPLVRGRLVRPDVRLLAVCAAMYLVTLAYVGHSRSRALPLVGIPVDVAHTAAVAVWLGGLAVMVFVVIPALDAASGITAFRRYGFAAQRAVTVIAITGVVQSVRLHGGISSLVTSGHGLLIVAKVAVVAGMILLAARNRRLLADRRAVDPVGVAHARRLVVGATVTEIALGVIVIGLTAVLVSVTPG